MILKLDMKDQEGGGGSSTKYRYKNIMSMG